jgi:hypothetical protein
LAFCRLCRELARISLKPPPRSGAPDPALAASARSRIERTGDDPIFWLVTLKRQTILKVVIVVPKVAYVDCGVGLVCCQRIVDSTWCDASPYGLTLKRQGPGHSCPCFRWLPISWSGQVRSRSSLRVRSPGSSADAVVLRSQTALTGSVRPRTIPAAGAGTSRLHR